MNELSMKPKRVGCMTTTIERVIHCSSNRGKGQNLVVVADVCMKAPSNWILRSEKMIELWGRSLKIIWFDFALITACAKLWSYFGGIGQTLIQPMKSMAKDTLSIQSFKVMNNPSVMIKRTVCNRKMLLLQRWWWWWWWW
jgi:hypothetical protein